jgi:hypothetical protein
MECMLRWCLIVQFFAIFVIDKRWILNFFIASFDDELSRSFLFQFEIRILGTNDIKGLRLERMKNFISKLYSLFGVRRNMLVFHYFSNLRRLIVLFRLVTPIFEVLKLVKNCIGLLILLLTNTYESFLVNLTLSLMI